MKIAPTMIARTSAGTCAFIQLFSIWADSNIFLHSLIISVSYMTSFESAARKAAKRAVRDMIKKKPLKAEALVTPFTDAAIDAVIKAMKGNRKRR